MLWGCLQARKGEANAEKLEENLMESARHLWQFVFQQDSDSKYKAQAQGMALKQC